MCLKFDYSKIIESAYFKYYLYGYLLDDLFFYKFRQFYHLNFSYFNKYTASQHSFDYDIMEYY